MTNRATEPGLNTNGQTDQRILGDVQQEGARSAPRDVLAALIAEQLVRKWREEQEGRSSTFEAKDGSVP